MQNLNKFNNLEKLLRSAKTPDVELVSHKSNLRRALMSMPEKRSNMKIFPNLAKYWAVSLAAVAVVFGGAGLYLNYQNQIKSPDSESKATGTASDGGLSDNIIMLEALGNSYSVSVQAPEANAINLSRDMMADIDQDNDQGFTDGLSASPLVYIKYYDTNVGISLSVPSKFGMEKTTSTSSSDFALLKYRFYYGGPYSILDTDGAQDQIEIRVYNGINQTKISNNPNAEYSRTGKTLTIGNRKLDEVQVNSQSDLQSKMYLFNSNDGKLGAIEVGYSRFLVNPQDGGVAGDSATKVAADLALYKSIIDQVLSSVVFTTTYNQVRNDIGGFYLSVPNMMNRIGTSVEGTIKYSTFSFEGRWGIYYDSIGVEIIEDFNKYLTQNAAYVHDAHEVATVNGRDLKIYTTSFGEEYLENLTFYSFTGRDGISYAVGINYIRKLNSAMGDNQVLVNDDTNFYITMADTILKSINITATPMPTIVNGTFSKYVSPRTFTFNLPNNVKLDSEYDMYGAAYYEVYFVDKSIQIQDLFKSTPCSNAICGIQFAGGSVNMYDGGMVLDQSYTFETTNVGTVSAKLYHSTDLNYYFIETEDIVLDMPNATVQFRFWINDSKRDEAVAQIRTILSSFNHSITLDSRM